MTVDWPPRVSLALLPTPLQLLERLSSRLAGPRIWVKRDDLSGSILSGNKVRKLEFVIAHALANKHDLLITCGGLQSNHCRATAFAGAQLGIPVHLVLRGTAPSLEGNFLLDNLAGAMIDCYPPAEYQRNLDTLLEEAASLYRQQGFNPYIIPTGASNGVGLWGYFAAAKELRQDFELHSIQPDLIVTATGSGGTQAGLTLGSHYFNLQAKVLGMAACDNATYFQNKARKDIAAFHQQFQHCFTTNLPIDCPIHTCDDYIGAGYGLASDDVLDTIAELAREEGVLLDPVYTGKAFHGLVSGIQQGRFDGMSDIVFIHTGGSFGVFPYQQQWQDLFQNQWEAEACQ